MSNEQQDVANVTCPHELTGEWSVWRRADDGTPGMIEGDLLEEIHLQMVADYVAEGETVWLERTAPAPE